MRIPQQLAVAATAGALLAAPLVVATTGADAATPFSVSVLHCGGGIHIRAYDTRAEARHALNRLLEQQKDMPHTLRTVQLRHGGHLLRTSKKPC